MFAAGWVDEVRRLRELPRPLSREALKALGYREIAEYLDGRRIAGRDGCRGSTCGPGSSPSGS